MTSYSSCNQETFYDTLAAGLLSPAATITDALYLRGSIPGERQFRLDDYMIFESVGANANSGPTERRALLLAGRAILNLELRDDETSPAETYIIARPESVAVNGFMHDMLSKAGADPASQEPVTYSMKERQLVPDPLQVPDLAAVYEFTRAIAAPGQN